MDEVVLLPGIAVESPRLAAPSTWAKGKRTEDWILAGAYFAKKWERDHNANDLSQICESEFDAACLEVTSISISAAAPHQHPRKG